MEHKNIKTILVGLALLAGVLTSPKLAEAQYYSQGNNFKSLTVDKKVRLVGKTSFLDNIDNNNAVFYHNDEIHFQINIENNGTETLNDINVVDFLPEGLEIDFTTGSFDKGGNTLSWTLDEINPSEIKTLIIKARIDALDNAGLKVNRVEASGDDVGDNDTSSYYIAGTYVPVTGANPLFMGTLVSVLLISISLFSRKLIRGYFA